MAQIFYGVDDLGAPFRQLRELSMVIAPAGNRVTSAGRKLVFILGGTCKHRFGKGAATVLQKGDVISTVSPVIQHYRPFPGALEEGEAGRLHALVLQFNEECFAGPCLHAHPEAVRFLQQYFDKNRVLHGVMDTHLFEMTARLREEAELQLPGSNWRITSLCAGGIVHLARRAKGEQPAEEASSPAQNGLFLVSGAKEYLLRHLDQNITMNDVARALHVSNGHLAHTFKRVAGQSVFTYFRHLRLEQAKLKLLNSRQNVTEIAAACGFTSTTLFCRNFKTYTGMTPLTYREAYGAKAGL